MKTEDLWTRVDRESQAPCWLWLGHLDKDGYGRVYINGFGPRIAHRVSYELAYESIPTGMELDHLCRVRSCINPKHLEPVTHRENSLRGNTVTAALARKTHCKYGHAFAGPNLIVMPNGSRRCRTCAKARARETYLRKLAAAAHPARPDGDEEVGRR